MSSMTPEDVIDNMIEIELIGGPETFRKVRETLTRMGVASRHKNLLVQTAHILHRRGKYYICHFKEMFMLDGLDSKLEETDIARRNRIAKMLEEWNMIKVKDQRYLDPIASPSTVFVIKHSDKDDWQLTAKYTMGSSRRFGRPDQI